MLSSIVGLWFTSNHGNSSPYLKSICEDLSLSLLMLRWTPTHLLELSLWLLIELFSLTATIGRIYFARLASTMLRHPRRFLCASGVLLLSSTSGSILQGVHHGMRDEPGFYPDLHQLFLSHFLWLASATLWDCLICGALLYNFSSFEKRFKFGSMNGKTSFGIALVFEYALFSAFLLFFFLLENDTWSWKMLTTDFIWSLCLFQLPPLTSTDHS